MHQRPTTQVTKAIPFVLAAAFFTTLMIFFVKLATVTLPIQLILFARYFVTLIIILPFIYFNPEKKPVFQFLKTDRLKLHLVRDILGLTSLFCYFYAAKYITLADATVLFNTVPLFIPIIAFFWGHLKILHQLWWGMGIGFLGILVILHPGAELIHWGFIIGLFSGFCAAIVFVGTRYLSYTEPPLRNIFYLLLIGTLISFVMLFTIQENFLSRLTVSSILLLIAIGVCGYLYQLCFTYGTKYAPVRLTSSFMYTSVIYALLLDWMIWGVIPTWYSIIGIILIIVGACLLLVLYPKEDYQKRS